MYILNVYIEGVRLELFEDETVFLNQSIQNIKDISKVFTDFTQSFSVPASDINSPVFEHWYNADIDSGFNAKVRKDAELELNYMPFKTGKMELNGVQLKNGKAYAYNLTFYGDLLNLSDLFGDDKLSDLDLSTYDHDYTSANVLAGITTGLSFVGGENFGSIIYPLISPVRNWNWDSQGVAGFEDDDIKYPGSGSTGISYSELKPAIKVNRIIEAIQTDYGVSFYGDFFSVENNHIDALYLWLNKEKGYINPYSDETKIFSGIPYQSIPFNLFTIQIAPEAGFETVEYRLRIVNTSNETEITYELTDQGPLYPLNLVALGLGSYDFYVSAKTEFDFQGFYNITLQGLSGNTGGVVSITNGNATISGNMPDMKLTDFMSALIKMFNLVLEPITSTTFNIKPLDLWYLDGTARDISEYIDISEHTVNKPQLYKRIDFKYLETETVIGKNFFETNKRGYGDLEAEFTYDGGVLEINVPFENIMHERISSVDDGSLSDMHIGKIIEVNSEDATDIEPVDAKPFLFYNRNTVELTTLVSGFAFIDDAEAQSEVLRYQNIGQENELIREDITRSLNFGSELGTWNLQIPPVNPDSDGGLVYSLYSVYWEDYITDLYDNKRREYKFKAIFPLGVAQAIRLNNILKIRDRIYTINNMNTNLTTGEVDLDLLNYIGAVPEQIVGEAEGFDYELDFNIN